MLGKQLATRAQLMSHKLEKVRQSLQKSISVSSNQQRKIRCGESKKKSTRARKLLNRAAVWRGKNLISRKKLTNARQKLS
jgi:hypothetical protein